MTYIFSIGYFVITLLSGRENTFFDYGVGALILFVSIGVSVITFVMVVICEALTFYGLGYRSFWRSFVISLLINLISTALGYGIAFIQYQILYHYIPFLLTNARTTVLEVLILFWAFWGVSIVSEGGVFLLLDKTKPPRVIWRMMVIANSLSYIILILIYFYLIGRHTL